MKHPMQCAKCFRVCRLSDSGKTWVCTICKHREKANGGQAVSDTPRVDDQECDMFVGVSTFTPSDIHQAFDFARQLERELNAANKIIRQQQLLEEENLRLTDKIKQLYKGAEEQKLRIKRLEDAGDKIVEAGWSVQDWSGMCVVWAKAKEAKP